VPLDTEPDRAGPLGDDEPDDGAGLGVAAFEVGAAGLAGSGSAATSAPTGALTGRKMGGLVSPAKNSSTVWTGKAI